MSEGGKAGQRQSRDLRLGAALRENLKRRKAQAKARSAAGPDAQPAEKSLDSAGIANENQRD